MASTSWVSRVGVVIVASLAVVAAVAIAVAPFKNSGISCGSPVVAAVHGKTVAVVAEGSTSGLRVLTKSEAKFYASDPFATLPGFHFQNADLPFVVCRTPARGRLLVSFVLLGATALGLVFVTRRRDTEPRAEAMDSLPA